LDACLPEEVADRLEHVAIVERLRSPPDLELSKQGDWSTPNVRPASAR
jgi:hypothetical protein